MVHSYGSAWSKRGRVLHRPRLRLVARLRDLGPLVEHEAWIDDLLREAGVADRVDELDRDDDDVDPVVLRMERARRVVNRADAQLVLALLQGHDDVLANRGPWDPSLPLNIRRTGFLRQAGLALNLGHFSVTTLLDTAERASRDLPAVWAAFQAGRTTQRLVEVAVKQSDGLDGDDLTAYDTAAADLVCESGIIPPVATKRLHQLREQLNADTLATRARKANERRHVTIEPLPDGQARVSLIGGAVEMAAVYDALTQQAVAAHGAEGETRAIGALKVDIALDLILCGSRHPIDEQGDAFRKPVDLAGTDVTRRRVPQVKPVGPTVLLTITDRTVEGANVPGHLAGYGPIDPETASRWAAVAGTWTRILLDPVTGGLNDIDKRSRTIPEALRRWLYARHDGCAAPWCSKPPGHCDIDHDRRYEYGGPTHPDNLAPLCRPDHHLKDDGMYETRLYPDGTIRWTSVYGRTYTVRPAIPSARVPDLDTDTPF